MYFDCQQNQRLPKLSGKDIFYSLQVCLYNTVIEVNERRDIHHHTWLETEMTRDANEVASAVLDYIKKLEEKL